MPPKMMSKSLPGSSGWPATEASDLMCTQTTASSHLTGAPTIPKTREGLIMWGTEGRAQLAGQGARQVTSVYGAVARARKSWKRGGQSAAHCAVSAVRAVPARVSARRRRGAG